jgi:hypothetical protein
MTNSIGVHRTASVVLMQPFLISKTMLEINFTSMEPTWNNVSNKLKKKHWKITQNIHKNIHEFIPVSIND